MTQTNDPVKIERENLDYVFKDIGKSLVLNEWATEEQLLNARLRIRPMIPQYEALLTVAEGRVKMAEKEFELVSFRLANVELFAETVSDLLVKKLEKNG